MLAEIRSNCYLNACPGNESRMGAAMQKFLTYLTDDDWLRMLKEVQRLDFKAGEVILKEGETRHAIFFIAAGSARVERRHMEFFVEIARLKTGEIFGEMSFLEGYAASASVIAAEPCEVICFDGHSVEAMIKADSGFAARFYRSLAEVLSRRLRETTIEGIAEYSWGGEPVEVGAGEEPFGPSSAVDWGRESLG